MPKCHTWNCAPLTINSCLSAPRSESHPPMPTPLNVPGSRPWGVVLDALEIVPVVGVSQSVGWRLHVVYTARPAPAPAPVFNVGVGKSAIGSAVVLFARQAPPGVV